MTMTTTDTAAVGLSLLSAYVQQYLTEKAVLIPTILDFSSELEAGTKTLDISRRTGFIAEDKAEAVDYTPQKMEWFADQLVLNRQEGVYVELTTKGGLQAAIPQEPNIQAGSVDALVQKLEQRVYTALAAASASAPVHKVRLLTAGQLTLPDISNARRLLSIAKCPLDMDRFLAIHPDHENDILNMDNFIDASKYGSNSVLLNGEVGKIYGFRVMVTSNVTVGNAIAYHRTAAAFARQYDVTFERQRALKSSVTEYLMETLYGLITLDGGKRNVQMNDTN